jgi:hypothetical protein
VLIWSIASTAMAVAHESLDNRGGYRNSAGEWLCGVTERDTEQDVIRAFPFRAHARESRRLQQT